MITRYYCTNIFSEQAKELIEFYRDILDIPVMKTDSTGFTLAFQKANPRSAYGIVRYLAYSGQDISPSFFKQIIWI